MQSTALKNIIANYGSKLWGFISIYFFIPVYIKILGLESFAVISIYTVILGIVSFADAGISSAVTREFAKVGKDSYKLSILRFFERFYASICTLITFAIFMAAPYVANKWLNANTIPSSTLTDSIRIIGLGIGLQLMTSIYTGGLMGLQQQVKVNLIQVSWNIAKTLGVIIVLYVTTPNLYVFFFWQVICNSIYLLIVRANIYKHLKPKIHSGDTMRISQFDPSLWKYLKGMTIIAILSSINIQADKIITSTLFTLREFGIYSLASTIAQLPVLLATPIAIAIFPVLTKLFSKGELRGGMNTFRKSSFWVNCIVFPLCMIILLYTRRLLLLWAGNKELNEANIEYVAAATRQLVVGGGFLALQLMPFYFLLSKGYTRYTIYQTTSQVLFMIPALFFFIGKYGLYGAGIPWLIANFGAFIYLFYIVSKKFLKRDSVSFIMTTIIYPFIISGTVSLIIYYASSWLPQGVFTLIYIFITAIAAFALNLAVFYRFSFAHFKNSLTEKL